MPTLVLVPSQLQASRVARRLCDAQGGLLFGPQVLTLDGLAAAVLAAGGERRPVLPPLAERLLVLAAGRAAGGAYAGLAPGSGLAGALARAVAELRAGEVQAEQARLAAGALAGAPAARLTALAAVLEAYQARLDGDGLLDRPAALATAAQVLRRRVPILDAASLDLLVLDGFSSFTRGEWALVEALVARSARTRFHVPSIPERPELSGAVEPTLRRIEGHHALAARRELEVVLDHLEDPSRAERPRALLAAFGGGPGVRRPAEAGAAAPPGGVSGQEAPPALAAAGPGGEGLVLALRGEGEEGEAVEAARAVGRLLSAGLDPAEVVVFHPAPALAAERLARAFAAEGIPLATGRGAPLTDLPPVRLVLDALAAAADGLDRRLAERLAGSSYLGVDGLRPGLGRLLDRAGALAGRAAPEAALRARAARLTAQAAAGERAALLRAADGLAALAAAVRPLGGARTPGAQASRLSAFLEASGLRRRAGRAEPGLAARDLAALARLEQAAEELARALTLVGRGAEPLAAGEWGALLALAVERAALPARGEPVAGAAELWALEEAPGRSARVAVVLGCVRGAFPAAPPPEPLLREAERQAVNDLLGRAALATAGVRRADALHRAACAVAAGREVVALGWAGAGPAGGGPPAPLAAEALAAVGVALPGAPPAPSLAAARTPGEALAAVARLAGATFTQALALLPPALAARAAAAVARGGVEYARREAVLARRAAPFAGQVEGAGLRALAARLPAEWSPTLLEAFARCPFRLLLTLGAGLEDPEAAGLDIDGRDEGRLLHAVLERWVADRVARRAWPPDGGAADLAEARRVAEATCDRFEREGRTGDPAVWAAGRAAVLARLDRIVAAEAAAADGLTPTLLEFAFGGDGTPHPALSLGAGGETVRVRGRIDRVDASPDRLLVVDYKNARRAERYAPLLEPEAHGVTSFQVPLYLLAAQRELPGRAPSATYQLLKSAARLDPVAGAPDAAALAAAVVGAVGRVRTGDLPIVSRDCEGCPFGAVCRFEGAAELGEGEEAGA
ncbi:MAG: PD-(D/E)XK nuclease family protein [Anaeromyxobacter sp.]|nr:PD-(D/E)XK nuclease family protein [Anaeromyxobacter sp.]